MLEACCLARDVALLTHIGKLCVLPGAKGICHTLYLTWM